MNLASDRWDCRCERDVLGSIITCVSVDNSVVLDATFLPERLEFARKIEVFCLLVLIFFFNLRVFIKE